MGEEDAKTPVLVRGELSFHRFLAREEQRREWIMKISRKNTPPPPLHKTPVSVVPTSMEGNVNGYFYVPARFVWTTPARKERLIHVRQAARFLDEVLEMEVDGNISMEAGRLRIFRGS